MTPIELRWQSFERWAIPPSSGEWFRAAMRAAFMAGVIAGVNKDPPVAPLGDVRRMLDAVRESGITIAGGPGRSIAP